MPRISVITPTYNRSSLLREAIDSVVKQTFTDWELLVVDDGSTDDTASVVGDLADPRVRYLYQENAGRSAARNRGLKEADGDVIAFLDDDDLFLPGKLADQVAFLDEQVEIDLVAGGGWLSDQEGHLIRKWSAWLDQPDLTFSSCLHGCPIMTCAVLFRQETLSRLDHWFDSRMQPAEDTDFFLRLMLRGVRCAWQREYVCVYRQHRGNARRGGAAYRRCYLAMLDKLFADPDLPGDVRQREQGIYAERHLVSACHEFLEGQYEHAQVDLTEAVLLDPSLDQGLPPRLVEYISGFAHSFQVRYPRQYMQYVFDHLPPELEALRRFRRQALSEYYMGQVFRAKQCKEKPVFRDLLLGVLLSPKWLTNRGIWSILIRDILRLP